MAHRAIGARIPEPGRFPGGRSAALTPFARITVLGRRPRPARHRLTACRGGTCALPRGDWSTRLPIQAGSRLKRPGWSKGSREDTGPAPTGGYLRADHGPKVADRSVGNSAGRGDAPCLWPCGPSRGTEAPAPHWLMAFAPHVYEGARAPHCWDAHRYIARLVGFCGFSPGL
jgi:hypothetical protein